MTQEQKFLTTKYTVYYYSPADGKLNNVESFTDTHVRVGASDLPATRRIISYENGGVVVKNLTFMNHESDCCFGEPKPDGFSEVFPRSMRVEMEGMSIWHG